MPDTLHNNTTEHRRESAESKKKPKPIPPYELSSFDDPGLSTYIRVVKNWNNYGHDSLPTQTSLDRIEHHLFFDVLAALPYVSRNGHGDNLMKKANYVVHFLLRMSENGDQLGGPKPGGPKDSEASHYENDDVKGTASSAPANEQQREFIVSRSARLDGTIQLQSQKKLCGSPVPPTLPPELVAYILQFLDASYSVGPATQ
ncbi:hypothetical protein HK102_001454, partial [Quaeritorhiza haematococci]